MTGFSGGFQDSVVACDRAQKLNNKVHEVLHVSECWVRVMMDQHAREKEVLYYSTLEMQSPSWMPE
jgi:hypothetical protein